MVSANNNDCFDRGNLQFADSFLTLFHLHANPLLPPFSCVTSATDENRLRDEFGQFGTVTDVFLPMERGTQRPRGFGFVTLSTRAAAENAISKMDQAQLDGRTIRVNESRPKGSAGDRRGLGPGGAGGFNSAGKEDVKLYVGNLAFDTPEEQVRQVFEQYGKIIDLFLPTDRETGKPRGFAFVTMPSADAEQACTKLNGYEMDGRPLRVNEAQPKGGGGGGGGGRGGFGGKCVLRRDLYWLLSTPF